MQHIIQRGNHPACNPARFLLGCLLQQFLLTVYWSGLILYEQKQRWTLDERIA